MQYTSVFLLASLLALAVITLFATYNSDSDYDAVGVPSLLHRLGKKKSGKKKKHKSKAGKQGKGKSKKNDKKDMFEHEGATKDDNNNNNNDNGNTIGAPFYDGVFENGDQFWDWRLIQKIWPLLRIMKLK